MVRHRTVRADARPVRKPHQPSGAAILDPPVSAKSPATQQPSGGAQPFSSLRRQIDRLFDDFGAGFWHVPVGRGALGGFDGDIVPQIEVSESDDGYKVTAELPGLDEKDIDVTIADDLLTLKGEKRAESDPTSPFAALAQLKARLEGKDG